MTTKEIPHTKWDFVIPGRDRVRIEPFILSDELTTKVFFETKIQGAPTTGSISLRSFSEVDRLIHESKKDLEGFITEKKSEIEGIKNSTLNPSRAIIEKPKSTSGYFIENQQALLKEMVKWSINVENMTAAGYDIIEMLAYKYGEGGKIKSSEYEILESFGFTEVSLDGKGINPKIIREFNDDTAVLVSMQYTKKKNS